MNAPLSARTDDVVDLSARTEEVRERLHTVLKLIDQLDVPRAVPLRSRSSDGEADQGVTEQQVLSILKARRSRDRFFDADLFADPAWDILLELYAAELGQRRMSVSSLCGGSGVPATTALRWIKTLEVNGLIRRRNDPMDGRRSFLFLSEKAVRAMSAYFKGPGARLPV